MRSKEINNHHILYCRKKWNTGHAKLLRCHPFMQAKIPSESLHEEIHAQVPEVPVPSLSRCKMAFEVLVDLEQRGALHRNASLMDRLDLLIFIWGGYDGMDDTLEALQRQKEIAQKFYLNQTTESLCV